MSKSTAVDSVTTWVLHPSRDGHIGSSVGLCVYTIWPDLSGLRPGTPKRSPMLAVAVTAMWFYSTLPAALLAALSQTPTAAAAAADGLEPPWVQIGPTPAAGYVRVHMSQISFIHDFLGKFR